MVSGASNRAPAFEMSPMPERTWSASTTMWSDPSIRSMRGARARNGASMRAVQRSGGSNTCESDDRINGEAMGPRAASDHHEQGADAGQHEGDDLQAGGEPQHLELPDRDA